MAKRVKMKAWRGWVVVDKHGRNQGWACTKRDQAEDFTYDTEGERIARVLVTEIPPKAKKAKKKEKR